MVCADLTGKTVVVMGANVGLGSETAEHFTLMNPNWLAPGFDVAARRMVRLRCVVDAGVTLLQYSATGDRWEEIRVCHVY